MSEKGGHIELERAIDSIVVGIRHRTELGDLDPLTASIHERGLLQPVTITPDGVLVCGRRRLEAVKRLGWRTLKVWVRSGISDGLTRLLAQRDENELRKPLTASEEARLFDELRRLLAEDATRRQEESRFGAAPTKGAENGGADSAPPSPSRGKTRDQAARLVTGTSSYQRLDQVNAIKRAGTDLSLPGAVRELAQAELRGVDDGGDVAPAFHRVKAAIELAGRQVDETPLTADEVEALAAEALARVKQERARGGGRIRAHQTSTGPSRRSLRAFILTWSDLDGWSQHYDPAEVGAELSEGDWEMFERVLAESVAFADEARRARESAHSSSAPGPS